MSLPGPGLRNTAYTAHMNEQGNSCSQASILPSGPSFPLHNKHQIKEQPSLIFFLKEVMCLSIFLSSTLRVNWHPNSPKEQTHQSLVCLSRGCCAPECIPLPTQCAFLPGWSLLHLRRIHSSLLCRYSTAGTCTEHLQPPLHLFTSPSSTNSLCWHHKFTWPPQSSRFSCLLPAHGTS